VSLIGSTILILKGSMIVFIPGLQESNAERMRNEERGISPFGEGKGAFCADVRAQG
jgi:hypothetical protein